MLDQPSGTPSKTDAARLTVALVDQFGTTVTPGRVEMFDIDDTFCVAHGGQQLAFWNAHHDERGFAPMHIYHAGSGAPVVAVDQPPRQLRCMLLWPVSGRGGAVADDARR